MEQRLVQKQTIGAHLLNTGAKEAQVKAFPTYEPRTEFTRELELKLAHFSISPEHDKKILELLKMDELSLSKELLLSLEPNERLHPHIRSALKGLRISFVEASLEKDIQAIVEYFKALFTSHLFNIAPTVEKSESYIKMTMSAVQKSVDRLLNGTYQEHVVSSMHKTMHAERNNTAEGFFSLAAIIAERLKDFMRAMEDDPLFAHSKEAIQMGVLKEIVESLDLYYPHKLPIHLIEIGGHIKKKINQLKSSQEHSKEEIVKVFDHVLLYLQNLQKYQLIPEDNTVIYELIDSVLEKVQSMLRIGETKSDRYFSLTEYKTFLAKLQHVGLMQNRYEASPLAKADLLKQLTAYLKNCTLDDARIKDSAEMTLETFEHILSTLLSSKWIAKSDLTNTPGLNDQIASFLNPTLDSYIEEEMNSSHVVGRFLTPLPETERSLKYLLRHPTKSSLEELQKKGFLGKPAADAPILGEELLSFYEKLQKLQIIYRDKITLSKDTATLNLKDVECFDVMNDLCTRMHLDFFQKHLKQAYNLHEHLDKVLSHIAKDTFSFMNTYLSEVTRYIIPLKAKETTKNQKAAMHQLIYDKKVIADRAMHYLQILIEHWHEYRHYDRQNLFAYSKTPSAEQNIFHEFHKEVTTQLNTYMSRYLEHIETTEVQKLYDPETLLATIFDNIITAADPFQISHLTYFFNKKENAKVAFASLEKYDKPKLNEQEIQELQKILHCMKSVQYIDETVIVENSLKHTNACIQNAIEVLKPHIFKGALGIDYGEATTKRLQAIEKLCTTPEYMEIAHTRFTEAIVQQLFEEFTTTYKDFLIAQEITEEIFYTDLYYAVWRELESKGKHIFACIEQYKHTFRFHKTPGFHYVARLALIATAGKQRLQIFSEQEKKQLYFALVQKYLQRDRVLSKDDIKAQLQDYGMPQVIPKEKKILRRK